MQSMVANNPRWQPPEASSPVIAWRGSGCTLNKRRPGLVARRRPSRALSVHGSRQHTAAAASRAAPALASMLPCSPRRCLLPSAGHPEPAVRQGKRRVRVRTHPVGGEPWEALARHLPGAWEALARHLPTLGKLTNNGCMLKRTQGREGLRARACSGTAASSPPARLRASPGRSPRPPLLVVRRCRHGSCPVLARFAQPPALPPAVPASPVYCFLLQLLTWELPFLDLSNFQIMLAVTQQGQRPAIKDQWGAAQVRAGAARAQGGLRCDAAGGRPSVRQAAMSRDLGRVVPLQS